MEGNIVKITILSKLISKFSTIPIKIPKVLYESKDRS